MNKAIKSVVTPGLMLTVAMIFLIQPQHAWSLTWWFSVLGCSLMGSALNVVLLRVQGWLLRTGATTINHSFYTKEAGK